MSNREELLLDAALRLLGNRGIRAVTHRAVDAEAGVGAGSTVNYFSTREALFAAVVEHFARREREMFEDLAVTVSPRTAVELSEVLAAVVRVGTGEMRALTLSRYALLVESANNPGLREQLAATGAQVSAWFANWMRLIGSSDPDYHVHVLGNYLTGLGLHQLAVPDPQFDPTAQITALLQSLTAAPAASTPGIPAPPERREVLS